MTSEPLGEPKLGKRLPSHLPTSLSKPNLVEIRTMTRKEKVLQVVVVAAGIVIVFLLVAIWLGTQIGD